MSALATGRREDELGRAGRLQQRPRRPAVEREGQDGWRHVYETGEAPAWDVDVAALEKLREAAAEGGTPPG